MKIQKIESQKDIRTLFQATFVVALLGVFLMAPFATSYVAADQFDDQINALNQDSTQKKQSQGILGAEASSLGEAISRIQAEIDAMQSRINDNQAKVSDLRIQIKLAEDELAKQKKLLGETIKSIYVEGDISAVEMLASSKDLSDFFDKQQYRESVRSKVKTTLEKITQLKLDLNTQKETVEKLIAEQQKLQAQSQTQRAEKDRVLALNQDQQNALDQQIKSNSAQVSQLRAQQAAAYAAYARAHSSSQYGAGESGNGGYPSVWANAPQDSMFDSWGMYNRECVSYVAWKIDSMGKNVPYGLGNAADWAYNASRRGIPVDKNATVGSAVMWGTEDGLGPYGHIAYVEVVNGDGSIEVSQYNVVHGRFSRMHVSAGEVSRLDFIHFQ